MKAGVVSDVYWQAALNDPEALRSQGLFLAEGRLVLERLLGGAAGGADAIVSVLATPPAVHALRLDEHVPDRLTIRTPSEMEVMTGFNFHRGVLAMVRRPAPLTVAEVIGPPHAPESLGRPPVFVVAEQLVDVDNVGSCFRNARGFGASAVLLDERCPDPLYRKAVRTSLGHVLDLPWAAAPVADILRALAKAGATSIGLTPRGGTRGTPETLAAVAARLDRQKPLAIVVGNEGHGLTTETMAACTQLASIPMAQGADSLNVATALAVALYELTRKE